MKPFKFSITIQAAAADQATQKAKALGTLGSNLDARTLTALAEVVKNDPAKVNAAKSFLGL